ncbi:sensor histidine kinase [Aurantibacter aestuarii]|uniref:histidine kinase n=1 Tax=Aurantibacter aestuarii TaxID=1266046 RepID=A0A2T1NBA7_9FLAO|nr:sensor histidine kinase [Aurantibacter aestuarii]PSG89431.1 hypothetical protein C7H52_06560 [Aurantibacter aestuarii]
MRFFIFFFLLTINFNYSQSDLLFKKSVNSLENNNIDSAAYYYRKASKISKNTNSKYDILYAKVLKTLGKLDSSYFYLDKAEKQIIKNNVPDSVLLIYALKAELSRSTVSPALNNSTLKDSELFYNTNKNKFNNVNIVAYYLNRKIASFNAFHANNKDTLQLILETSKQIFNLDSQVENKEIIAYTLNEIAQIYEYKINDKLSLEHYKKAEQYSKDNELWLPYVDNSINYARYYQIKELDSKKAIDILLEAEKYITLNNDTHQASQFYQYLTDLYALRGEFEEAYDYYKKTSSKNIEIESRKNNLYIKQLEFENKISNKQNELNLQKQKLIDAKKTQKLFYLIVFMVLISLCVLIFYNNKINKKNKELKHLSNENEFLLGEANHRINNNLQLITILISEELEKYNESNSDGIKKILSKVESISTLHRHLYKSENKKKINIQQYLLEIKNNFHDLFKEHHINHLFDVESFEVDTDVSMYLGLLLTELYINTIKHAFQKNQLKREVEFHLIKNENNFTFIYSNNGENKMDKNDTPKLISTICRQLKVNFEIETSSGFKIKFLKNI